MTATEALHMLQALVDDGWLIGVEVFGADFCCAHGIPDDLDENDPCESRSYGLCDTLHDPHSVGSDCNRAEPYLMRPHDLLMVESIRNGIADNW